MYRNPDKKNNTIVLEDPENADSNFFEIFIIYFGLGGVTSQKVVIFVPKIIECTLKFTEIYLSWNRLFFFFC